MDGLKTVGVAAAIIYEDGRILACERGHGEWAGFWEFPGGKLEEGETASQACVREVAEELGARLSTVQPYDVVEWDYPTFHLHMDVFVCQLLPGEEPRLLDHAAMRWLSQAELTDVNWLPADHDLIERLGRFWGQAFAFDDRF